MLGRASERRRGRRRHRTLVALRRRWPGALTAWVVYGVVLAPLSGILPFGRLRGAGIVHLRGVHRMGGGRRRRRGAGLAVPGARAFELVRLDLVAAGALVTVLLGWSVLSWSQAEVWRAE